MTAQGAYGEGLGRAFGMPNVPVLKTQTLRKSQLAVTQLRFDGANFGMTPPLQPEDAFLVALQVREVPKRQLWLDGRPVACKPFAPEVTSIYDLRRNPVADVGSPFHSLMFYLPRQALNEVADEVDAPHIDDLRYRPGVGTDDPVIRHLGLALLPALAKPAEASPLFVDYVALAIRAHVAHVYGRLRLARRPLPGGLMTWQERRAKEILAAHLDGEVALNAVAKECGLSVSHFTRAFRQSTGTSPHRWLLEQRVAKAKELLRHSTLSLAEISLACGFADQSHFTRVFTRQVGTSPGASRRLHQT